MRKLLRWTWELPQTLLGLCILPFYWKTLLKVIDYKDQKVYIFDKFPGGVSLGYYVLVDYNREYLKVESNKASYYRMRLADSIKHESGHGIQSRILGPLYLFTVGITSACWNLLRRASKKLGAKYFDLWPENQADKLGRVNRHK